MTLLIRNGEIITSCERRTADILCELGVITAICPNLHAPEGAQVIDATGKYIFPVSSIPTSTSTCPSWVPSRRMIGRAAARPH